MKMSTEATSVGTLDKGATPKLEDILQGMSQQLGSIDSRLNRIETRLNDIESKISGHDTRIIDLENGVSHMEIRQTEILSEIENIKKQYVEKSEFIQVRQKLVDLSNRGRRNSVVLHGIPENPKETTESLKETALKIFTEELGLGKIDISRIHRTPAGPKNKKFTKARMVHIKIHRWQDREDIIKKGPKILREKESNIFISDDVDPVTRKEGKLLRSKAKAMREDGKIAFVPLSVPRILLFKEGGEEYQNQPLRSLRLTEEEAMGCLMNTPP